MTQVLIRCLRGTMFHGVNSMNFLYRKKTKLVTWPMTNSINRYTNMNVIRGRGGKKNDYTLKSRHKF
jgi:hypothetical protein